ncbi:MAG: HAMP domain-containing histidine kinase [Treponema sp.]|jgi:two-component system sensor histidine kinase HydH|nr:HAMP domain-containing histidine kinase [Treponema sp.]
MANKPRAVARARQKNPRLASHTTLIVSLFAWLFLSVLTLFILWSMRDRARLIRDNDNERILSSLFTSLRTYDEFGEAIEATPILSERIRGLAIYDANLSATYQWGKAPNVYEEAGLGKESPTRSGRYTIPNKSGRSVTFILNIEKLLPPPAPPSPGRERQKSGQDSRRRRQSPLFSNSTGTYLYIDITHPAYWRTQTLTAFIFPFCEIVFFILVFYIRHLYLRNRGYRERIEAQQNLVVLGTAASTLAHEIKNPLLAIRLQTGILRKIVKTAAGENGEEELSIIEEEIDRISTLIYRVNDYLREDRGNPAPVRVYNLFAETSMRLCNRNIIREAEDGEVFIDPGRFRSALENSVRNALESGGPEQDIGAAIKKTRFNGQRRIVIAVFDRGAGFSDIKRAFDPFYTTKSAGTGIGLSISKRFIEAANGTIVLENRAGGGARVTITLPEYIAQV